MKEHVSSTLLDNEKGVCTNKILLSYPSNDMSSNSNGQSHLVENLKLDLNNEKDKFCRDSGFISNSTSEITVSSLNNNYSIGNDTFYYSHNLTPIENRVI